MNASSKRHDEQGALARWRAGDQQAGDELFSAYFPSLYRFFANKVRDISDAEDLLQTTFEAVLTSVERFEQRASFKTFLFAIAHNQLKKYYRRAARAPGKVEVGQVSIVDQGAGPQTHIECADEQQMLLSALRQIPLDMQIVVELRYLEELPLAEIADILQVNANTVRSRLVRARAKLAEVMQAMEKSGHAAGASPETWPHVLRKIFAEP